jgi:hypothetical protein
VDRPRRPRLPTTYVLTLAQEAFHHDFQFAAGAGGLVLLTVTLFLLGPLRDLMTHRGSMITGEIR